MINPPKPLLSALATLALAPLLLIAGCTTRPFEVEQPRDAWTAVEPYASAEERGPHDYNPDPRPVSLCYSTQINTQQEVMERARSLCPNNGKLVFFGEDAFVNGCALFQPNRVTFLCTPGPQPPSPYE